MFEDARYDVGINWCFFTIKCKKHIASFRLHMDDNSCWKLFELLDKNNKEMLSPSNKSSMTFRFGSSVRNPCININNEKICNKLPEECSWLNIFLKDYTSSLSNSSPCEYFGVIFYEI